MAILKAELSMLNELLTKFWQISFKYVTSGIAVTIFGKQGSQFLAVVHFRDLVSRQSNKL